MDETIRNWSAYHHERLDGSGYPFHISAPQLTYGCRIMTVADVFTALVENRPYRRGMPRQESIPILQSMVTKGWLDGDLVQTLSHNFDELNGIGQQAEASALHDYESFALAWQEYEQHLMAV
jgi:HD-GYP domain-containing protein (c-di-GMP phosphodiesterase class II)